MKSLDGFEGQNNLLTPFEFRFIQGAGQLAGEWAAARAQPSEEEQPRRTDKPLFVVTAIAGAFGLIGARDPRAAAAFGIVMAASLVGLAN